MSLLGANETRFMVTDFKAVMADINDIVLKAKERLHKEINELPSWGKSGDPSRWRVRSQTERLAIVDRAGSLLEAGLKKGLKEGHVIHEWRVNGLMSEMARELYDNTNWNGKFWNHSYSGNIGKFNLIPHKVPIWKIVSKNAMPASLGTNGKALLNAAPAVTGASENVSPPPPVAALPPEPPKVRAAPPPLPEVPPKIYAASPPRILKQVETNATKIEGKVKFGKVGAIVTGVVVAAGGLLYLVNRNKKHPAPADNQTWTNQIESMRNNSQQITPGL